MSLFAATNAFAQTTPIHGSPPSPECAGCPNTSDSTYSSAALRDAVNAIAQRGRQAPSDLLGYRVSVESEIALIVRTASSKQTGSVAGQTDAREHAMQVEQVESVLQWQSNGAVNQHLTGYRSTAITANISTLSFFHRPWLIPVLYGNRLQMLFGHDSVAATRAGSPAAGSMQNEPGNLLLAVHPFSEDRERFYRFTGGDTIAILHLHDRSIPVMRINVKPTETASHRTLVFRGEIDVDATRMQIVRMKGQFVVLHAPRSILRRVVQATWNTIAFAELVNGEFDGRFWLPTEQRIEGQARTALAGEFSPIIRVVSRFRNYQFNGQADAIKSGIGEPVASVQLTFAPRDSLSAFTDWSDEIGSLSGAARASDFDEVAPDSWRTKGRPRIVWHAQRLNDVLRFNRVEGAYTGVAASLLMRDRLPGMAIGADLGWAWTEQTARGGSWIKWSRGPWSYAAEAKRTLANTNDFRPLLDYEQSLMALLATADDYDYVDRRSLSLGLGRVLPVHGAPVMRFETGLVDDRGEHTRVKYGIIHLDSTFRANRPVSRGSYVRSAVGIEFHPNVSGEFVEPGVGAGLGYERGDGTLGWQRLEARLAARRTHGPFSYAGRIDAIAVFTSQVLPQQLIEFGENEGLPGYAYKEFGGDRAVLSRAAVTYQLPILRAPIPLGHWAGRLSNVYLPGISPSIALGFQTGWSIAASQATRKTMELLGTRRESTTGVLVPATRPTGGLRSTVNATLRLFGGTVGVGVARPLDGLSPSQGWRLVFGVGQPF